MTQYKNPWNKVKKCIIKTVKEKQTFPFINSIICVTSLKINQNIPWSCDYNSSVIKQKGESQNRCFKKINHAKFSEKQTFLNHWYTEGVRNVRFLENLACFVFLKRCFEIRPFALLSLVQMKDKMFLSCLILKQNSFKPLKQSMFTFTTKTF